MLNKIWAAFFLVGFAAACVRALFLGQPEAFQEVVGSMFEMARTAFEIALGLAADLAGIVAAILVCYLFFG